MFEGGDDDDKVAEIGGLLIPKVAGIFPIKGECVLSSMFNVQRSTPSDPAHECTPTTRIARAMTERKMSSSNADIGKHRHPQIVLISARDKK